MWTVYKYILKDLYVTVLCHRGSYNYDETKVILVIYDETKVILALRLRKLKFCTELLIMWTRDREVFLVIPAGPPVQSTGRSTPL